MQPRLVAWGGDVEYRYSGQTLQPRPFTPALADALARVVRATNERFNHVLANRYRDEQDSMGFHADDEPELGPEPVVATVSFGATRRFVLLPRRKGGQKLTYELGSGSLLVMRGPCQARYRHGVPKEPTVTGERLSLTFRRVLRPPG
jgi:alkylated DNA repair dioxygenase AlkB